MKRRSYGLSSAPRTPRRARLGNITLVPASMLPLKRQWQQLAGELPASEALLFISAGDTPLRQTLRALVPHLRASGWQITTLPVESLI